MDKLSQQLVALGNPLRREILQYLRESPKPKTGVEISERLEATGSVLSKHMKRLKASDLVTGIENGRYTLYVVNEGTFGTIVEGLNEMYYPTEREL